MSLTQEISFNLNGKPVTVAVPVHLSTLALLRDTLKMTGTKLGCGEGECGACTILVDDIATNSCIMFAVDCEGREIITIEGIQTEERLTTLQQEFVAQGAVQCGFCTPGMIMQGTSLIRSNPRLTVDDIKRGLEGNLCRCTGYTKIIAAIASAVVISNREGQG